MRVSISITNFAWREETLAEGLSRIARAADSGGLHGVWVADHLLQADPYGAGPDETEMLEAYTTLGYLAACTARVTLGTMVTGVTFRPPALLVKAVTTLDVLSGGRALFGVGAGYQGEEAAAMGLPLPPVAERFGRLEETIRIARQMWSGDEAPFHGEHFRLDRPVHSPATVTRPHPPILIGGTGERRTLPLVARYADACNVFDIPDGGATARHKLSVLEGLCRRIGRPYGEIEKTISTRLGPGETAGSFVDRCRAFLDLGIDHVGVVTTGPWTEAAVAVVAEAVPELAALGRGPDPAA